MPTPYELSYPENQNSAVEPKLKICSKCKFPQSTDAFYKSAKSSDGFGQPCKTCVSTRQSHWYENNTERGKEAARKYRRNIDTWATRALQGCRKRSKSKDVPFNLKTSDLLPLPELCPIFKCPLDYCSGADRRFHASVDRIVPELGYVVGNVRILSFAANVAKMNGNDDIFDFIKTAL
jgi:hypothetical protein